MTEYKANNLLLMWLQIFHLHCINHDFRNWSDFKNADQKDTDMYKNVYMYDQEALRFKANHKEITHVAFA